MIDDDWECLNRTLLEHSTLEEPKKVYRIFNHTWSIIDNTQRLKVFCKLIPSESEHKFLELLNKVCKFRDHQQKPVDFQFLSIKL